MSPYLQLLMVDIFKANLNPIFMNNIFTERDVKYNLRSKNHFQLPNIDTGNIELMLLDNVHLFCWSKLDY